MAEVALAVPEQFRAQADWSRRLGSPLYAHLLSRAAEDYEAGGPVRELLEPHAQYCRGMALPLQLGRVMTTRARKSWAASRMRGSSAAITMLVR